LVDDEDELDYSIRVQQFFDCLLKRQPEPEWMTAGFTLKIKGCSKELDVSSKKFTP
jgi:hypothetical protein